MNRLCRTLHHCAGVLRKKANRRNTSPLHLASVRSAQDLSEFRNLPTASAPQGCESLLPRQPIPLLGLQLVEPPRWSYVVSYRAASSPQDILYRRRCLGFFYQLPPILDRRLLASSDRGLAVLLEPALMAFNRPHPYGGFLFLEQSTNRRTWVVLKLPGIPQSRRRRFIFTKFVPNLSGNSQICNGRRFV